MTVRFGERGALFVLLLATLSLPFQTAVSAFAGTVDKTLDLTPSRRIEITNVFGSIDVRGSKRSDAEVSGDVGAGSVFSTSRDGDVLKIAITPPQGHTTDAPTSSQIRVRVPDDALVSVNSVMADVNVLNTNSVNVFSSTGRVSVRTIAGALTVRSVNGDVDVSDATRTSTLDLQATSGKTTLENVNGSIEWSSVSGSIKTDRCAARALSATTTSGDVTLTCDLPSHATYRLRNRYGSSQIVLAPKADVRCSFSSRYGHIEDRYDAKRAAVDPNRGSALTDVIGVGSAHLDVESDSGNILLK